MTETVQDYWESQRPKRCKGCECAELDWDYMGNPMWGCELERCYLQSPSLTTTEDEKNES